MKTPIVEPHRSKPLLSRRQALKSGLAAMTMAAVSQPRTGLSLQIDPSAETLVPFLDMPRTPPNRLDWETLDSWITPQDQVFNVQHYGIPEFDLAGFKLEVTGLVKRPKSFTMEELTALTRQDRMMTLECSGNGAFKGFMNAVYNSQWTGTPLVSLLKSCELDSKAKEIVFFGEDRKEEILRPGTERELKIEVPFGRSMSVADVMATNPLLSYRRNDQPLEKRNGAPLRLIVPGWYGIANVKWLTRIDVRDRRYMGRYMGRDYVTVRGERQGDEVTFVESSVAKMNLKSVVARVTRGPTQNGLIPLKASGAAWGDGTKIERVETRIDGGPWRRAKLGDLRGKFCWVFFSIDLGEVKPGKHSLVSRAIDANGRIQPSADDDEIALKKTYWEAYQQWPREIEVQA